MPLIKGNARIMQDGTKMIQYTDTVGPSYVTYTLETEQEMLMIANKGLKPITFAVGTTTATLNPGEKQKVKTNFTSFQVKSSEGIQQFEALMDEVGTVGVSPEAVQTLDGKVTTLSAELAQTSQELEKKANENDVKGYVNQFKSGLEVSKDSIPINLFNFMNTKNEVIGTDGSVIYTGQTRLSADFTEIDNTKPIYTNWLEILNPAGAYTSQNIVFYDANKVFVSNVTSTTNEIIPPSNAVYARQNLESASSFNVNIYKYQLYQDTKEVSSLNKITGLENIIHAKDFIELGLTDSQVIDKCLEYATLFKSRTIVFDDKDWNIDKAILLPSNTNVIIDNCTIKQNDQVFDNVFRGNNLVINDADPDGYPTSVNKIENISILGIGDAKIIGCDVNAIKTHPTLGDQEAVGDFWGWRTLQISLSKCTNFEISGLSFTQTRCWAVAFDKCSNGYIHDINIKSRVKTGDGVDIRSGCHDIKVENIYGDVSDDTVAMTAISYFPGGDYVYPMEPSAFEDEQMDSSELGIHDIHVKNIYTRTPYHGVICLSANGRKVRDIYIDTVLEPTLSNGRDSIVYLYTGYGTGYTDNDIHNIRVNNVLSKYATNAVSCQVKVNNVWFNKIQQLNSSGVVSSIVNMDGVTITNS